MDDAYVLVYGNGKNIGGMKEWMHKVYKSKGNKNKIVRESV